MKKILIVLLFAATLPLLSKSQFSSDYCLLQQRFCRQHKHIACSRNIFRVTAPRTNFSLIEMTPQLRSHILDALNDYRSRIALGRVPGFPTAGNLPLLTWQREFEYLMEEALMKSEYAQFYCVSTEEFKRPYETAYQFIGKISTEEFIRRAVTKFMKKEIVDNYDLEFSTFYNADIERIGCAAGQYHSQGKLKNVFRCLVNQWAQAPLNESYKFKDPCSKCNTKGDECDIFYQGLCVSRFVGLPGVRGPPGPAGPPGENYHSDEDDCDDDDESDVDDDDGDCE